MGIVACGGSDSGADTADAGGVVESGDGLASLTVEPGSLPEGVSLEDVELKVIVDEAPEPGVPVVAVQLLPDGLALTEPATLTVALPEALHDSFMAIHMSGDIIEFLGGDIQQEDEGLSFATSIDHFSLVAFYDGGFLFDTTLAVNPEQVSVEQTQNAITTLTAKAGPVSIWMRFKSDSGMWRKVTLSGPENVSFPVYKGFVHWEMAAGTWAPDTAEYDWTETPSSWEGSASSTCKKPNETNPSSWILPFFNVTLVELGEPKSADFVVSEILGTESVGTPEGTSERSVRLLEMSSGDTVYASAILRGVAHSVCTEEGESSTSSGTGESEVAIAIGEDPEGDGFSSSESEPVTSEDYVPGADIKNVRHVVGGSGENCFIIEVYGDGETAVADASNYQIFLKVVDPDGEGEGGGWEMRVEFKDGLYKPGSVDLGLNVSFPPELEGAEVSVEWLDSSTMKVTVAGAGTALGVESFSVRIFTKNYYDDAEGVGAS